MTFTKVYSNINVTWHLFTDSDLNIQSFPKKIFSSFSRQKGRFENVNKKNNHSFLQSKKMKMKTWSFRNFYSMNFIFLLLGHQHWKRGHANFCDIRARRAAPMGGFLTPILTLPCPRYHKFVYICVHRTNSISVR